MSREPSHAGPDAYGTLGEAGTKKEESPPPHGGEEAGLLDGLRDGQWLHAQDFPALDFHVPQVLPEGQILFVGAPKVGKSWWLLGTGLAVASGGKALGCLAVKQRPVLYLALEDGDRRLQNRCRTLLGVGEPIPAAFEYMTRVRPGHVVPTIRAWLDRHPGSRPMVMLDTLGKVMPPALPGESAYQRDYRVGSALKELADDHPGSAVLVNHHDRKAGAEDFVDAVSGTHGLAGAADTIVVLSRPRHETAGSMKITGRDIEEDEYRLELQDGGAWVLVGGSLESAADAAAQTRASAGLGDRSADIIRVVAQSDGIGPTAVAEHFGPDISPAQAGVYLTRLAESGRLLKTGRGVYQLAPQHNSFNGLNAPIESEDEAAELASQDPVETVETVMSAGQRANRFSTGDAQCCNRCRQPAARLILGRCPACAYPAGGAGDDTEDHNHNRRSA